MSIDVPEAADAPAAPESPDAAAGPSAPSASDHRRLGRELDLFASDPLAGPGLPLWLPDGAIVRGELERLVAEQNERDGCRRVHTPVLGKRELFERSGHVAKFADDMYPAMRVGGEDYLLRPANCPHHVLVYAARPRSFRDLPVRLSELASMFRSELSGVLSGLSRVRQINLDDCHVFCRPDQVGDEVALALASMRSCHALLGVEVAAYRLSRRGSGDGYLGSPEQWAAAEDALADVLRDAGVAYVDAPGEAAFYGPKIDVQIVGAGGHELTLSTVQLDFQQPQRFELSYAGSDGRPHVPVMIHRGLLSSMERLVAYLLERTGGALPPWLAPLQVAVLPVAAAHEDAAAGVVARLRDAGLRAEVGAADESLGARIRRARDRRVPYVAVLGDREVAAGSVALRLRGGAQRSGVPVGDLVDGVVAAVRDRASGLGFA